MIADWNIELLDEHEMMVNVNFTNADRLARNGNEFEYVKVFFLNAD